MNELEEKIKKELLKSGFPLQIFCQRCLLRNKWGMSGSEHMIFDDESKKEIDTHGYFQKELNKNTTIFYILHVECKKNHDNPWVFFKEEYPEIHLLIEYENIAFKNHAIEIPYRIEGLHFHHTPVSSIYTMAFQSKGNQIHEAISSVLSSYQFDIEFSRKHRRARKPKYKVISVNFLIILLDGKLYLATVEKDDSINLAEKKHIIYYHREVKYPRFRHYNIEVVTKDYFPNYLRLLNKDRKLISEFYRREISAATA